MSETKTITGVCEEVSERGEWTTFAIDVGGQYPVKLSTTRAPLIELGRAAAKESQLAIWTFDESESEKTNPNSGKPYINRYLSKVEVGGTAPDATPTAQGMSQDGRPDRDRIIARESAIKSAAQIFSGAANAGEDAEAVRGKVLQMAGAFETWIYRETDAPFQ